MDAQVKIFKLNHQSKILFLLSEAFVVFVIYAYLGLKLAIGSGFISILIFVCFVALCVLIFRLKMSEALRVTQHEVVQNNFWNERHISLDSIRGIHIEYRTGRSRGTWIVLIGIPLFSAINGGDGNRAVAGDSRLSIITDDAKFIMGQELGCNRLEEAATYILEQIRIYYPENYAVIQREKQEKEDEKAQKQCKAVAEFWRR